MRVNGVTSNSMKMRSPHYSVLSPQSSVLVLILLFALFLRLWHIQRESFWADEGWTMLLSDAYSSDPSPVGSLSDVVRIMADDQHPPLYFAMLHYWIRLTGNSEFAIRLFSAFASLIGVALIYRLGKEMFSPGAGVAAALILALTDNDIMLAREARHYAQMSALVIASSLFYWRMLKNPNRGNGVGWLLTSIALMYTHYLGGFILLVQGLHTVLFVRPFRRVPDLLFRLALVGVAWLPWAFVFIGQASVRYTRPILYQSTMPNTSETFAIVRSDLIGSHFGLTGGLILLGLVYVAYVNGAARLSFLRRFRPTLYALLWLAIPILVIVGINPRFPILTTRNFLIVTPVIALLIGHGLMNLDRVARTLAIAVLIGVSLITVDAYHIKPPYRDMAADIRRYGEVADRTENVLENVLIDVWTDSFALRYHIGRVMGANPDTLPMILLPEWRERYGQDFTAYILEAINGMDSFWLAYWGTNQDGILDFFPQHGFVRTAALDYRHLDERIDLFRYDRISEESLATFTNDAAENGEGGNDVFALMKVERTDAGIGLLWRTLSAPGVDFSISVYTVDAAGNTLSQHDSSAFEGRSPTSAWQPGDLRYDFHPLAIPPDAVEIRVKVYWYANPVPLRVTNETNETREIREYYAMPIPSPTGG
jgi:hypothetical protein